MCIPSEDNCSTKHTHTRTVLIELFAHREVANGLQSIVMHHPATPMVPLNGHAYLYDINNYYV